jgi:hypothetical protein
LGNQWYSLTTDYDHQYKNIGKSVLIERESEYTNLQTAPEHDLDSQLDINSLGLGLESHLFENIQWGASHHHGLNDHNDHEYGRSSCILGLSASLFNIHNYNT